MKLYLELGKFNENLVEFFVYSNDHQRLGTVYYSYPNGKYKGGIRVPPKVDVIGDVDEFIFKDLSSKESRKFMETAVNIMESYKK